MDEAAHDREAQLPSPASDPDIQEALSRRYSDQVVVLLKLRSGNFAVYNNLRELCGIVEEFDVTEADGLFTERLEAWQIKWPPAPWRPPPPPPIRREAKIAIDLEELGLLK